VVTVLIDLSTPEGVEQVMNFSIFNTAGVGEIHVIVTTDVTVAIGV
jgi:hypothetical protein